MDMTCSASLASMLHADVAAHLQSCGRWFGLSSTPSLFMPCDVIPTSSLSSRRYPVVHDSLHSEVRNEDRDRFQTHGSRSVQAQTHSHQEGSGGDQVMAPLSWLSGPSLSESRISPCRRTRRESFSTECWLNVHAANQGMKMCMILEVHVGDVALMRK